VILAITGASCALSHPFDRILKDGGPTMTDSGADGDAVMTRYDARDATVEVNGEVDGEVVGEAVGQARITQLGLEDRILALVNRERQSAGVKPLSSSPELAKAARVHSAAMAQDGFFEHRGAQELALFERVAANGTDTDHVGENIFETNEGGTRTLADECVQMWMQSDDHRLNLLSPEFDKTGIAVGVSSNGENYITEDFAH
jgi:uncharacterized protein YkwD